MEKIHLIPGIKFNFIGKAVVIETVTKDGITIADEAGTYNFITYEQLHSNLIQGEVKSSTTKKTNPFKLESKLRKLPVLNEEKWEIINKRKKYIEACTGIPYGKMMEISIHETHERIKDKDRKPCMSSVRNWALKYVASNYNPESLLPINGKKGKWERIDPWIRDACLRKIHEYYMTSPGFSISDTLGAVMRAIDTENITRLIGEKLSYPSFKYVRKLINEIPRYDRDKAREGANYVRGKYRQVMNKPKTYPDGLHVGQMDHTPLDVLVVDEKGRLIGKPTLTIFIHVPSRCIYGYYLGFSPPSLNVVAKCFKHAVSPKPDLKNKYLLIKNKWLPFGPFDILMVDNGLEFHSGDFERLCSYMHTEILYCGRGTPQEKPHNERFFGTLNEHIIHKLGGTTKSNPQDRKEYKSEKEACVTLDRLKSILNAYIVDVYHEKPHTSLKEPPRQVWQRLINPSQIPLMADIDDIDLIFSKSERRAVSHRGVTISDIWYSNQDLKDLRKQVGDTFETEVRYDEDDLSKVWVFHPYIEGEYITVTALDKDYTKNLSFFMHKSVKEYCKKNDLPMDNHSWRIALAYIHEVILNEPKKIGKKSGRFIEPSIKANETIDHDEPDNSITTSHSEIIDITDQESFPTIAFTTKFVKRPGGYDE